MGLFGNVPKIYFDRKNPMPVVLFKRFKRFYFRDFNDFQKMSQFFFIFLHVIFDADYVYQKYPKNRCPERNVANF